MMHPRFPFADVGKLRGEIGSRRDFHKHIREVHTRQSRVHFLSQPWKPYPGIGMADTRSDEYVATPERQADAIQAADEPR